MIEQLTKFYTEAYPAYEVVVTKKEDHYLITLRIGKDVCSIERYGDEN